jgi:general secretion pathway protein K
MATKLHLPSAGRRSERGAALLVAMVAIAILTALAVDLAYEARVRLQIAANGRDELRATYLAKSGVNLSRLVLGFQQQIDGTMKAMSGAQSLLSAALGGQPPTTTGTSGTTGGTTGTTNPPAQGGMPGIQIWNLIPVNSGLISALFQSDGKAPALPEGSAKAAPPIGDFGGAFEAKIEDEGTKVNLQFDTLTPQSSPLALHVAGYLRLVCDPKWDPLFDREDETGQRWTRQNVAEHLRDWADADQTASTLAAAFPAGNCSFVVPANPFEQGVGDENFPYDRGPDRYKAKNARLDSLEELHLVAGISDAFMAAFGDQVTVYMPRDAGINVNVNDPAQQLRNAWIMSAPGPTQALLADEKFQESFFKAYSDARGGGWLNISATDFAKLLTNLGVQVKGEYLTPSEKQTFTDKSLVFRIRATGSAGNVEKNLEAVVTFDPTQNTNTDASVTSGQPSAGQTSSAGQPPAAGQPPSAGSALSAVQQLSAAQQLSAGRIIHWWED